MRDVRIKGKVSDIMIAGYILNPSANDYSPVRMAQEYGALCPEISEENETALKAAALKGAWEKVIKQIEENDQLPLLYDIEMPLSKVLSSMEVTGFLVDRESIQQYGAVLEEKSTPWSARFMTLQARNSI